MDEILSESIRKYHMCPTCIEAIAESWSDQCSRCGATRFLVGEAPFREKPKRITHNQPEIRKCKHCFSEKCKYERIVSLGRYDGLLRILVLRTKRDYSGLVAQTLTRLLWREREKDLRKFAPDLIVPVPMYIGRFLRRGICAPIQMADILSKELGVPACLAARRMRNTQLQWGLSPSQRKKNVLGSFMLAPDWDAQKSLSILKGKRILIVDDIVTTGVTCDELAKLLVNAGAGPIMVAVFARSTGEHTAR